MRWLALFGCLAAGCSFTRQDGVSPDGAPGADADGPAACASYSTQVDTCLLVPSGDLTLQGKLVFDTNSGTLTAKIPTGDMQVLVTSATLQTPSGEVQAILAANVTLTSATTLRAEGSRPIAIFATGTITIEPSATIDVAQGGAGARTGCGATPTVGTDRDGGAGGGGGDS
ncbi:MAG: hypothetical protein KIT31_29530 [Deltaproteobacteria bacterium]|nr:hypothetical protein [Deltaproteobacteria bacterium]